MADKFPTLEIRDFLFYLVPGGFVLVAILLLFESLSLELPKKGDFSETFFSIVLAYGIGHICHSAQYPWRKLLKRLFRKQLYGEDSYSWEENQRVFKNAWLWTIEHHNLIYKSYVERPRSLSRFALAMIAPVLFLTISIQLRYATVNRIWLWCGSLLAVVLLIIRYIRYDRRFRERVWLTIRLYSPDTTERKKMTEQVNNGVDHDASSNAAQVTS